MKVSFFTKYHEVRRVSDETLFKPAYTYDAPDADVERWRKVLKEFDACQEEMAKVIKAAVRK